MNKLVQAQKAVVKLMEYHYFNSESPARYHAMISISDRLKAGNLTDRQIAYWATK
jgi:hypothetical protein